MSIVVDLSGLKIKDLALFEQAQGGNLSQAKIVELLDRVVVGGASELPLTQLRDVLEAVRVALAALGNPVDVAGKA